MMASSDLNTMRGNTMRGRAVRASLAMAACAGLAAFALTAILHPATAAAQSEFSRSYINPFPEGDRYRLAVFGDSLADGVWSGLSRAFENDRTVETLRKSRASTGFSRPQTYDWNAALKEMLAQEKIHIAVILIGINDTGPLRAKEGALKLGSDEWREAYGARLETFTRQLKAKGVGVYWVGLPIMRSPQQNEDIQVLNEIFRERAFVNGVKFIDTWNGFADQFGRYSAFGPDLSGQVRRLRVDDGVHFTVKGYEKLAHFVEREIRRDLNFAKAERNIPLAGDAEEQARALGRQPSKGQARAQNRLGRPARRDEPFTQVPPAPASEHAKGDDAPAPQPENRKVAGVEIFRPALPEAALNAAQSLSPTNVAGSLPEGETIASEMAGGLTALATVSPVNDAAMLSSQRSRQPLTERAYYRVLIKGEQLEPKTGRADDFAFRGE
jgi:hypothetical protein